MPQATVNVYHEFERVCDKYVSMFELYCEKNIYLSRVTDDHVMVQRQR